MTELLGKLGKATTKAAEKAEDEAMPEKVRSLGDALTAGGTDDGADD